MALTVGAGFVPIRIKLRNRGKGNTHEYSFSNRFLLGSRSIFSLRKGSNPL
jgi:hypothetical protein